MRKSFASVRDRLWLRSVLDHNPSKVLNNGPKAQAQHPKSQHPRFKNQDFKSKTSRSYFCAFIRMCSLAPRLVSEFAEFHKCSLTVWFLNRFSTAEHSLGRTLFLSVSRIVALPFIRVLYFDGLFWYGTMMRQSPVDIPLLLAQSELLAALLVWMTDFEVPVMSQSMLELAIKEVFHFPKHSSGKWFWVLWFWDIWTCTHAQPHTHTHAHKNHGNAYYFVN